MTYEVYKGMLDNQNMLLKAKKVQITYLKTENGFMDLKVMKEGGQTFDYDMETKSETNAAIAKMVRFFEYVTIETNPLEHKFSASQEPINPNAWQILSLLKLMENITKPIVHITPQKKSSLNTLVNTTQMENFMEMQR